MNRFSSTVRLRKRLSSWWMKAMPRACGVLGPARRVGRAVERSSARSRAGGRRRRCSWSSTCPSRSRRPGPAPRPAPARGRRRAAPGRRRSSCRDLSRLQHRAQPRAAQRWRCASITAAAQDTPPLIANDRGEGEAEQLQALVDDGEEQGAEHRPDHLALAAEQADAADHRGADDVEQDALAQHGRAGLEPAGVEDGGDARRRGREIDDRPRTRRGGPARRRPRRRAG